MASIPRTEPNRLHPMTMLHRLILGVPGFIVILLPVLRSGDTESWFSLYFAIALGAIGLPIVIIQYRRFRYWITPDELVIHSGVIKRQHRNIPIERIQNVEIVQRLLPRVFGTAKVNVVTAGSTATEGVLEYVSLKEAQRIRQVIRSYQAGVKLEKSPVDGEEISAPEPTDADRPQILYRMSFGRVLLSGMFRFSLFYIAIIFSTLQLFEPDPEELVNYIEGGVLEPYINAILTTPILAVILLAVTAACISWISGIIVNINRYFGFRLEKEGSRIHKRSGLLTVSEGTIPLPKIQAIIRKTNPMMRRFGWWSLSVQTMGHDVNQQRHKQAVPFGTSDDTIQIAHLLFPFSLPDNFDSVSRYTIRRMIVRLHVVLLLVVVPVFFFWKPILWALLLIPVIVLYSILRYRNHGYFFDGEVFGIRRGVIRHVEWSTSIEKFHVFYLQQSIFQRRYGLKTLYIDTAGASPVTSPSVVDLPGEVADSLVDRLYDKFQSLYVDRASEDSRSNAHTPR